MFAGTVKDYQFDKKMNDHIGLIRKYSFMRKSLLKFLYIFT